MNNPIPATPRTDWSRPETHPEQLQRRIDALGIDKALGLVRWADRTQAAA
ncbi:MAG: hypothetical protein ACTH31_08930 [Pseudoclavibacter sp.]